MTEPGRPRPAPMGARRAGAWRRTAAWYRAPAVVVLAAGVGIATGRPDVVALAAPLAIGWIAALLATRPLLGSATPRATTLVDQTSFGSTTADLLTTVTGTDGVEMALVAQPGRDTGPIGWLAAVPGGPATATVRTTFDASTWGTTTIARPDTLGLGPDALYRTGPVVRGRTHSEVILPAVAAIAPLRLPPILGGWAGAHVSRRPGQGSDLVDLREFAPGDRLRSIHWRAYARHQRLYTRRTLSDADVELMICLDLSALLVPRRPPAPVGAVAVAAGRVRRSVRQAVEAAAERRGRPGPALRRERERQRRASSLDLTVAAAAAVASAHLGQGDRVGLVTATVPRRTVRAGTGNRQLQRIRHTLAMLDDRRQRPLDVSLWGLRPGQVVVWCSPMVTEGAFEAALDCRARGHEVIVIDTVPLTGMLRHATADDVDHLRVLTIERELRFDRLRGRGIPVLSWDAGDISGQLAVARRLGRGRR